jgi:hypothetical protein
MKIIIQAESPDDEHKLLDKKEVVYEHVHDFFITGTNVVEHLVPNEFGHHSASYRWLLGTLSFWHTKILRDFNRQE